MQKHAPRETTNATNVHHQQYSSYNDTPNMNAKTQKSKPLLFQIIRDLYKNSNARFKLREKSPNFTAIEVAIII